MLYSVRARIPLRMCPFRPGPARAGAGRPGEAGGVGQIPVKSGVPPCRPARPLASLASAVLGKAKLIQELSPAVTRVT